MLANNLYRLNIFIKTNSNSEKCYFTNHLNLVQILQVRFFWIFLVKIMKLLLQIIKIHSWFSNFVFIIIIILLINLILKFIILFLQVNDFMNMILSLFIRSIINRMMSLIINIFHFMMIMKIEDMKDIVYSQFYKQFQFVELQIYFFCNLTDFSTSQIQLLVKSCDFHIIQVQLYSIIFFINFHNMLFIIIFFLINWCFYKWLFCKSTIILQLIHLQIWVKICSIILTKIKKVHSWIQLIHNAKREILNESMTEIIIHKFCQWQSWYSLILIVIDIVLQILL